MHEKFFEEIGEEAEDSTTPDFERIAAIAASHGIEIPPPPGR